LIVHILCRRIGKDGEPKSGNDRPNGFFRNRNGVFFLRAKSCIRLRFISAEDLSDNTAAYLTRSVAASKVSMFPKRAAMQENNGIKTDWLLVQILL
jgi:hypothetical protein